jgi:hypothetical protein
MATMAQVVDPPGRRTGGGLLIVIIWVLPSLLTRHPSTSDREKAINDTRTVLVTAAVATGAAGGLAYTARTYWLSRQGNFTDPYSKAVEQLGNKEWLEVRLGGIYALERLVADSARDPPRDRCLGLRRAVFTVQTVVAVRQLTERRLL